MITIITIKEENMTKDKYSQIYEINSDTKCCCHCFHGNTLVGLEKLRIDDSSDLPHIEPEVRLQIAIQLYLLSQAS